MCPPTFTSETRHWSPLLAMACSNGYLYVYNLAKNVLVKKLLLYNYGVQGLEWVSANFVLTWSWHAINTMATRSVTMDSIQAAANANANNNSNSSGSGTGQQQQQQQQQQHQLVRNELFITDLRTGESRAIRDMPQEESPIAMVKLSTLKQFMVVIFKEQPLEIWDMRTFSLIKKISKKSPLIRLLEWWPAMTSNSTSNSSGLHATVSATMSSSTTGSDKLSRSSSQHSGDTVDDVTGAAATPLPLPKTPMTTIAGRAAESEGFVCIDEHGLIYNFKIEANQIREGGKHLPYDGLISPSVTAMAMKKSLCVFGDADGTMLKWDPRNKYAKTVHFKQRGEIRKLRFAPGKENPLFLVHLSDGSVEIYEIETFQAISSFRVALFNARLKLVDVEWCASDKLLLLFSDNNMFVFDINFRLPAPPRSTRLSAAATAASARPPRLADIQFDEYVALRRAYHELIDNGVSEEEASSQPPSSSSSPSSPSACFRRMLLTSDDANRQRPTRTSALQLLDDDETNVVTEEEADKRASDNSETTRLFGKKALAFALLAHFMASSKFERLFWSLLSYSSSDDSDANDDPCASKIASTFVGNNWLLNKLVECRAHEYLLLNIYKWKRDNASFRSMLINRLLLNAKNDVAFNILLESELTSEADYLK